jgi:hypothetical protein
LEALATFLQRYCPALRSYLRTVRHYSEHEAEDVVQAFVADKIIEKNLLQHADQRRGRFRSFLLTSFTNYCISRARAQAGIPAVDQLSIEPETGQAPDALLEAEWARALVGGLLALMRDECVASGRMDVWAVFHARTVEPVYSGASPESYETLARRLGLSSPTQAANLLVTGKRMYARLLRSAIAEYEFDDHAIEQEVADLHRCLQSGSSREVSVR